MTGNRLESRLRVGIIEHVNLKAGLCRFRDIDTAKVIRFKCPPKELAIALFEPLPGRILDYMVDGEGHVLAVSQATAAELEAAIAQALGLQETGGDELSATGNQPLAEPCGDEAGLTEELASMHGEHEAVWAIRDGHHVTVRELQEHLAHFDADMPILFWDGAMLNPLLTRDFRPMRYVGRQGWEYLLLCLSDNGWNLPPDIETDPAA